MGFGPFSSESSSKTVNTAVTDSARGATGKRSKIVESGAVDVAEGGTLLQPGASQSEISLAGSSQYNPNFSSTTYVSGVTPDDLKGVLAIQQAGLAAGLQQFAGNLANQAAAENAVRGEGDTLGERIASSIGAVNVPKTTRAKIIFGAVALLIVGIVLWLLTRKAK